MLSGGGDHGAYEVGALEGLIAGLPKEQTEWSVVTGASLGGVNAWIMGQHKIGEEATAVAFLKQFWSQVCSTYIFKEINQSVINNPLQ